MENQDHERSVMLSVLAGVGIGVLVGAIAGLLLAPKSGSETRENIGQSLKDLGNKVGDLSNQVASRIRTAVEHGKKTVAEELEKAVSDEGTEAAAS